ncbi:MAG: hypothetical protein U1E23_17770 [Reyranellaceae bacterium]
MSDPVPAVTEAAAVGETAALFADIRDTIGVRVVNLVWRHLATIDGALPWAWQAAKPLYLQGLADRAAVDLRAALEVPRLAGLEGPQPASVDAVLASYDHSNTVNLLVLGALLAWLRGETASSGTPAGGDRIAAPDLALPKLLSEGEVSPQTWACVLRLNRFGDTPQPLILASMYRHLAHEPAFLERLETALAPVQADGSLDRAIRANRARAMDQSRLLARTIEAEPPRHAERVEQAIADFVEHAIGKMVTIGRAIRLARG